MGIYPIALGESFHMNTNLTGFRWFSKRYAFFCHGRQKADSIGRVNHIGVIS